MFIKVLLNRIMLIPEMFNFNLVKNYPMYKCFILLLAIIVSVPVFSQDGKPTDFLSSDFHKERRSALRAKMPENSVAVFFANPVRNRANDVDYIYHQDPDFYYLTGYREPHAILLVFSDDQKGEEGETFNEMIYVQEKNKFYEMWTGKRLGVEGAKNELGFEIALNGKEFLSNAVDFSKFDQVLFKEFENVQDPA